MKPAPAFDCACCGRHIGKTATHHLIDGGRVICTRCAEDRKTHTVMYPACPVGWHDVYDHGATPGTRAGIAAHLGMWP